MRDRLRELLVDEVFTLDEDESRLDPQELFSSLRAGRAVFRSS